MADPDSEICPPVTDSRMVTLRPSPGTMLRGPPAAAYGASVPPFSGPTEPSAAAAASVLIRLAAVEDAESIRQIYNYEVSSTMATFDLTQHLD